ncbi:uncharacterized protein LOC117900318 [Drosophila subobscura]|uniref:uncharacterized protein LOC117900318 n=1 Tax=Drosophila subobscura TaxID=7241 RepID=UPI00155B3E2F|nr:uncharacterized protein LOC117900318 [Drosophila subobscura]XP_034666540.1 uncharacterized protein LOC117900318 [Drosophila subobscura]XP_034666541.1 uncharacterized protein LOC117900318 [Drosophila subobscura]
MLNRQPDYTISDLGHPCPCDPHMKADRRKLSVACFGTPPTSPSRLLPMRETLNDYFQRLLMRQEEEQDDLSHQKQHKNQWNEQQRRRNQKCRDKGETAAAAATTTATTTTTCDLNNF